MPRTLPLLPADSDSLCCAPLGQAPLSADEADRLATRLKALADPARLRLLSILLASDGQRACTCDLTEPLGLSQPTVSHHLKKLTEAGLLEREQRGKWAYFTLNPEATARLAGLVSLEEVQA